jgi:hypothetical protein
LLSYSLLRCAFRERSNRAERLPRPETPQFVPTEKVPSTLPSLARSSVMLLLRALDTQMLAPSKAKLLTRSRGSSLKMGVPPGTA